MGLLDKVFGTPAKGVADAAMDVARGAADIVERWAPSDAAKHKMYLEVNDLVQKGAASARQYDPRSTGGGLFGEILNVLIDGINRLIRPVVAITLIGGVFGWWTLQTSTIDPVVLGWGEAVIIFYFGARTLFKDLPSLIKAIKEARK